MSRKSAFWLMLIVTAAWGASYMWMKLALTGVGPLSLVGWRFGTAFLATIIVFFRVLRWPTKAEWRVSLIMGTMLFSMFALIMLGLETTDASTAGFLMSTTTVFVAILEALIHRTWPRPMTIMTILVVMVGLYLLVMNGGGLKFSGGALFCLGCSILYAAYIMYSGRLAQRQLATLTVSVWQLGVAGVEGLALGALIDGVQLPTTVGQWGAILALGLICSAFGFVAQTKVQHYLPPATVSLIYTLEPIFSALFAYLMLHEIMTTRQWLGAALIFFSVMVSELVKIHRPAIHQN